MTPMSRLSSFFLLLSGLLGILPGHARADFRYQVTLVGTLGGSSSFALDINNRGQVTGNASKPNGRLSTFLSPGANGTPVDLGRLPGADADFSRGYAINDAGKVVGESSNNTSRAFLFVDANGNGVRDTSPSDEMTDLGTLGGSGAVAHDINNRDQIVGIASTGVTSQAFLHENGAMRSLGSLDGLATSPSRAWGINDLGQVVGFARTTVAGVSHAFLYADANGNGRTDPGEMIDLDAAGDPNRFSQAYQINDLGQAVGDATVGTTAGGTSISHPFLWQGGTRTDLGTLGFTFGSAMDINESGIVVGNVSSISGSPARAFQWTQGGGIVDLNSLIDPASGWVLRSAEGINDLGQIVGYGSFGGSSSVAFLLTPVPEPTSLALLGLGLTSVLVRHRRRSRQGRPG